MRILDPGHRYAVNILDGLGNTENGICIGKDHVQFVKREGEGYPGNVGHHYGTNCQELVRVLIHRLKYLDSQIPDHNNIHAIKSLRDVLRELETRAAQRHGLSLPRDKDLIEIEKLPTCLHCGHIVCKEPIWDAEAES